MSLDDLEILLLEKRRRLTEHTVRRFVAAEQLLDRGRRDPQEETPSLRPPDTWRGASGGQRLFQPMALQPIGQDDQPTAGKRTVREWLLLIVEALVLVGLVVVAVRSFVSLRELNEDARALQQTSVAVVPTTAPTQDLPVVTPESSQTLTRGVSAAAATIATTQTAALDQALVEASPNEPLTTPTWAEPTTIEATATAASPDDQQADATVDANVAAESLPTGVPTPPEPGIALRLVIPSLDIDAPVVEGDDWETLKGGIGHRLGSANPGEAGNMILSAHNDVYGEIFRYLNDLKPGEEVIVHTLDETFVYTVDSVDIVLPSRVDVMDPTDYPSLTLITCYPYLLDTHRVVAKATLSQAAVPVNP